ncbi:MAG: glycine/sarcosine/betaine reductase component B subunit, partial [Dehalococcoidia bacterium]
MKLELGAFNVREVAFADSTRLSDGVLYIDRAEVVKRVLEDDRFIDAQLHLVRPGDPTRLINLL